jgi:hypothetical protein
MNRRVIVTVGTGEFYCKNLDRLIKSFTPSCNVYTKTKDGYWHTPPDSSKGIDLLCWYDCFPEGSRSHDESPYGFKVFAIKSAYEKGYTSILWLDSPAYAVKEDISPIFDKIEKEGYYAMSHIDPLENWVSLRAMHEFNTVPHDLYGLNLPSGSCYGFDLSNKDIYNLFSEFEVSEKDGLFKSEPIAEGKWHRHDEAVLALLLLDYGYEVFTFDPLFQSDSPECVIKSGGQ